MSNDKSAAAYHGGQLHPAYSEPKKKKRIFMWFFLAVNMIFLIMFISGMSGAGDPADTGGVLTQEEANAARDIGTGLGAMALLFIWAVVDFVLVIIWAVVKFARK